MVELVEGKMEKGDSGSGGGKEIGARCCKITDAPAGITHP